jgi:HEAT repeat protein
MLASGDACSRLDALQQMMAVRQRDPRVHTPEAQALVRAALGDADPRVRFWAVAAAGELHHRGTVPFLVERLGDIDLRVRYRAARSLGLMADPSGIEPLRQQVRGETWYAADYARQALRHIAIQRGGL